MKYQSKKSFKIQFVVEVVLWSIVFWMFAKSMDFNILYSLR